MSGDNVPVVELINLRKEYDSLIAVRNLNLLLEPGDIFGFIGPNGAGKTTTIKMLATLLQPSSGTARVAGVDVVQNPEEVRGLVGYMPDFFGVYDDIKVLEYLDFFAAAYRIPKAKRREACDYVLALTDMTSRRDSYVETLSRGMKQRLCLAKTLIHDPKLLLLDEPASGLDPRARIEIRELLLELQRMGKTIIISSHILPEMEEFCNKIGIIERGEMIVEGDVNSIARQVRGKQVLEVEVVDDTERAEAVLLSLSEWIGDVSVVRDLNGKLNESETAKESARTLERHVRSTRNALLRASYHGEPGEEHLVLSALVHAGLKVCSFSAPDTDLEDVFLSVTRGSLADPTR